MGNVLPKTPEPAYAVVATRALGYEVRAYPPLLVAEVDNPNHDNSASFRLLAGYIGAFTKPANTARSGPKPEAISMTAPVVMPQGKPEPISMTAPVQMSGHKMQFVMPAKYTTLEELPVPTNPAIHLKEVPARRVGVLKYSGKATDVMTREKLRALAGMLAQDALVEADKAKEPEKELEWQFCGYDAPFVPGPLRRNEVWVDLQMTEEQIKQKLAQVDAACAAASGAAAVSK